MAVVEAPPLNLSAVLLGGKATVIFPSKPYTRVVRSVNMVNSASGGVTIYRGTVGAFTIVSKHPQGSEQEYNTPFKLPAGQSLFVQWDAAPASVSDVRAIMTWMETK